ncbi:hypothetical protein K438DRAFT_1747123 [Mycena galopus ATCC 62051]|nr:hypothetical protein K438DRAFT_1747123 [Mycena galopus ATCC 62051]
MKFKIYSQFTGTVNDGACSSQLAPSASAVETTKSAICGGSPHIASIGAGYFNRLEDHRKKNRERMPQMRAAPTEEQRERHREAQRWYRERSSGTASGCQKNAIKGKDTLARPKARQYWSDPDLMTSDEEEEEEECKHPLFALNGQSCSPFVLALTLSLPPAGGFWDKCTSPRSGRCPAGTPAVTPMHRPLRRAPSQRWGGHHLGLGRRERQGRGRQTVVPGLKPAQGIPGGVFSMVVTKELGGRWTHPSSRPGHHAAQDTLRGNALLFCTPGESLAGQSGTPQEFVRMIDHTILEKDEMQATKMCTWRTHPIKNYLTSPHMATLPRTNLGADEVIMDTRPGARDSHYYCLPPFRGNPNPPATKLQSKKFAFYLVSQGHVVGVFDDCGYPDNSYRGYHSMEECIDTWQGLCKWGIHPQEVDPEHATVASPHEVTVATPQKSSAASAGPKKPFKSGTPDLKRWSTPRVPISSPQKLATPQKTASTSKAPSSQRGDEHLNFAICGGGVVSSSAHRTEEQYLELQSRGEEPDLLLTRSLQAASFFALDDGEE